MLFFPIASKRPPSDATVRCRLCGERFRMITHTHLRSRHGWRVDSPTETYKRRFGLESVWSPASLRIMSRSLVDRWDQRGRRWDRRAILRGIRTLARHGGRVHFSAVWDARPELYWTAQRLFGSWRRALAAAGIPRSRWTRERWTRERVVRNIRRLRRAGRPVTFGGVWPRHRSLYWAAQRTWGSWQRALRAAGVPAPSRHA